MMSKIHDAMLNHHVLGHACHLYTFLIFLWAFSFLFYQFLVSFKKKVCVANEI